MIARLWSARTAATLARAYLEHFSSKVLPELQTVPGFAACSVLTRAQNAGVEILVITHWHSFQAIEEFAGPGGDAAVVAPEAAALLTDYDRRVRHFDLAISHPQL